MPVKYGSVTITTSSCAGNFRSFTYLNLINSIEIFHNGINPFGGAYADVTNKFYELCQIYHNIKQEYIELYSRKENGKRH